MSEHQGKFHPQPTRETAPFWEGCRAGELRIQRCDDCGHHQFYPRIFCTACSGSRLAWTAASGTGTIASFTVVRRPLSAAYADDVPYVVALVRLEEGPVLMTNIVECPPEQISIGAPVTVVFERWSDEITIPKFRLART